MVHIAGTECLVWLETYRAAKQSDSALAIYERIIQERVDDRPGMTAEYFRAVLQLAQQDNSEENHETARGVLLMIAGDDEHLMSDQARLTLGDLAYREGQYNRSCPTFSQRR